MIRSLVFSIIILLLSCKPEEPKVVPSYPVSIALKHHANALPLVTNTLAYTNAAGNTFSVEKLQYIISDITFHKNDGEVIKLDEYHFVDISDGTTLQFDTEIQEGSYSGISFVFGLNEDKNISGIHTDLNALSWSWPDMLGGGYHFMKLEGRYIDAASNTATYTTHMGTAREITPTDTLFHANYINLHLSDKEIVVNSATTIDLEMEISNWYELPHTWDFNLLNTMIMGNYEAQLKLKDNGKNVFSIGQIQAK